MTHQDQSRFQRCHRPQSLAMEEAQHVSSVISSSPSSMSEASHCSAGDLQASIDDALSYQKLCSNISTLIHPQPIGIFSDVLMHVSGHVIPLHRCVLAARSPFFMSVFSRDPMELSSLAPVGRTECASDKLEIDMSRVLDEFPSIGRVGYDAFMTTIGFLYSGKQSVPDIKCVDEHCLHEACGVVVEFSVQMLSFTSTLEVMELKTFWQQRLHNIVQKAQVDEVVLVLGAAHAHGAVSLASVCKQLVATSSMDKVDLGKRIPLELVNEIENLRCKMGLQNPEPLNPTYQKQCEKIRKSLDSGDIELVQLLLKEGQVNLDDAYALHYAVLYCNPNTVKEILELGLTDVNLKNNRGFTVLHYAAMRRDPSILVSLLFRGSSVFEITPEGLTALQLCSRLTRQLNDETNPEAMELQNERLSVEILYQAGLKNLFEDENFPPVSDEKELFDRLLFLENRVAVARLLFPQEVKIVTGISHLEATSEFVGIGRPNMSSGMGSVDLNQNPVSGTWLSTPVMNEALMRRMEALQKTVILGRRMFPRCTAILNQFVEEDHEDPLELNTGSPEEQSTKKRRYCELKEVLEEAFRKDVAAMERPKVSKHDKPCNQQRVHKQV